MSESRCALITGAGRGIGRSIAIGLATYGWTVGINYLSDHTSAAQTLLDLEKVGGRGILLQGDISRLETHKSIVDAILNVTTRIDLLVNNAGMAPHQRVDLLETTEASYDEVLEVNLKGPFFLTQIVAKVMLRQGGGMIINIGSMSAYASSINRSEYCIAKAGMAMVTKLFADRLAEQGILVYEIRPGIIETDMTAPVHEKYDHLIAGGITPIRRWGKPEDVAQAVVALSEGRFPFSTGEIFNVDGGFHLRRL